MRKNLTLFFIINSFLFPALSADTYTVSLINLQLEDYQDQHYYTLIDDLDGLSPISSRLWVRGPETPLPYPSQQVTEFPATINLPATQLDMVYQWTNNTVTYPWLWLQNPNNSPQEFYIDYDWPTSPLNIPAISVMLDGNPPENEGECTTMSKNLNPALNLTLQIPAGEVVTMTNLDGPPSVTLPPGIVLIPPYGSGMNTHPFKNSMTISEPLDPLDSLIFYVCKDIEETESIVIAGYIEFQMDFSPEGIPGIHDLETNWTYQGQWNILTEVVSEDFSGNMEPEELINSFAGDLVNVNSDIPDAMEPVFNYEQDPETQTPLQGWLEIDFAELLGDGPMESFELKFEVEAPSLGIVGPRTFIQPYPNLFAVVLGQLRLTYAGTGTSVKLPVYEIGSNATTAYQTTMGGLDNFLFRFHLYEGE